MCNLGSAIERIAEQRGKQIGEQIGEQRGKQIGAENMLVALIQNLKESMGLTTQQAMDALKVPKAEQPKYAAKV